MAGIENFSPHTRVTEYTDSENSDSIDVEQYLEEDPDNEYYDEDFEYSNLLRSKCETYFQKSCHSQYAKHCGRLELCLPEAAYKGDESRVDAYINSGTDVNSKDKFGNTALHLAIVMLHNGIARKLLTNGACVNSVGNLTVDNQTPVHAAAISGNNEGIRILMDGGAIVDTTDSVGETPIHLATRRGHLATVKLLLECGADINIRNVTGRTCVFSAVYFNHWEIVELLMDNGIDYQISDILKNNVLHVSRQPAHMYYFASKGLSVDAQNNRGETPMFIAVMRGEYEKLGALLDLGANPNIRNVFSRSPLHEIPPVDVNEVKQLLEAGAKVNIRDDDGITPIHLAAEYCASAISLLAEYGANVNAQNSRGETPLFEACKSSNLDPVTELLRIGGDPNITNFAGESPLLEAVWDTSPEAIDRLLEAGADLHHRDNYGRNALALSSNRPEMTAHLLKQNMSTVVQDKSGFSALHHFTKNGDIESMKLLLEKDISLIGFNDRNGATALHLSAFNDEVAVVECLLDFGAALEARDENGRSAIFYAAAEGNLTIVECLQQHGTVTNAGDNTKETLLDVAVRMRNENTVRYLTNVREKSMFGSFKTFSNPFTNMSKCQSQFFDGCSYITSQDLISFLQSDNTDINTRTSARKCCLGDMLKTPSLGKVDFSNGEDNLIKQSISDLLRQVSEGIEQADQRFKNSLVFAGSSAEDTKVGFPDEFDVMVVLESFSVLCAFPVEIEAENVIFVPIRAASETIPCEFEEFFRNGVLLRNKLFKRFSLLFELVISSKEFIWPHCLHPSYLYALDAKGIDAELACTCTFVWRGSKYIRLEISIDIVPAIYFKAWPTACQTPFINSDTQSQGFHLVAKPFDRAGREHCLVSESPFSPQNNLWRMSFAAAEQRLFQLMQEPQKDAYRLCKVIRNREISPLIKHEKIGFETGYFKMSSLIPTYFLKIALFNILSISGGQDENTESKSVAIQVYKYLEKCFISGRFPFHFIPSYNLLTDKERLKQNPGYELEIMGCQMAVVILSSTKAGDFC